MPDPTDTADLPHSPYPGIEPYRYADRKVFFAREAESRTLLRLIVMYRGVLLYSDSGSGKSSLINAGLVPLAIEEGLQPQRIRVQPKRGQEIVVECPAEEVDGKRHLLPSMASSDQDQERRVLSVGMFLEMLERESGTTRPLLIFDQFEEWTTLFEGASAGLTPPETRAVQGKILDAIVSIINDSSLSVKLLISLREDYLAKLTPLFRRCPSLPDQYLRLTPLDAQQIHRVIRGPFEEYPERYPGGISFSLADEIRRQFESRSEADIRLTEVQVVCQSLFQSGKQGKELEALFTRQGGVQGILEQYMKQALDSLPPEQREPAVCLLARMVTSAGTRNVISEDDLLGRVEHEDMIPRELLGQTLASLERDTKLVRREPRREVYYYEIASEFLVDWIHKEKQEYQVYLRQRQFEEAERAREGSRRAKRRGLAVKATLAALVVFLTGYLWFYVARQKRNTEEAHARRFALAAKGNLATHPEHSLLLADVAVSETYPKYGFAVIEAEQVLRQAFRQALQATGETFTLGSSGDPVYEVTVSADLKRVAVASRAKIAVWDLSSWDRSSDHHPQCTVDVKPARRVELAFNADATRLASRDASGKVWDACSCDEASAGALQDSTFEREVKKLKAESLSETVTFRDTVADQVVYTLRGSLRTPQAIALSPDGSRLATSIGDGSLEVWDTASGQELRRVSVYPGRVLAAAFSPEGKRLATASSENVVALWDVSSGRKLYAIPVEASPSLELDDIPMQAYRNNRLVFSADGKRLAMTGWGGGRVTAKVWELRAVSGQAMTLRAAAFSADGTRLATASQDGTLKVLRVDPPAVLQQIPGNRGIVAVAFSAAGLRLAVDSSASGVSSITIRDLNSGGSKTLPSFGSSSFAVTFSPDGSQLAAASRDGSLKIWDLSSGRQWRTVVKTEPEAPLVAAAFSPDGKHLATANAHGPVKILDALAGQELQTFSTCWFGSVWSQAKEVRGACETAVTLDPDNVHIRDSRGLARALAGDKRGAIEDFEAYVRKAEDADRKSERQAWIAALRQGKNPFTPEVLKTLFSQY